MSTKDFRSTVHSIINGLKGLFFVVADDHAIEATILVDGDGNEITSGNPLPVALESVDGSITINADLIQADTAMIGALTDAKQTNPDAASASLLSIARGLLYAVATTVGGKLDQLHTDLATTLAAFVDGLETLITSTNSKLDQLHTDATGATPAGENMIGAVVGEATAVGATMQRPNDTNSYAIGDIIAQSTTAGSCSGVAVAVARANDKTGMLRRCRVKINDVTPWTNAVLKVHVFKDPPTFTNGDNAAFSGGLSESNYIGSFDVTLDRVFSDYVKGIGVPTIGSEMNFEPHSGSQNIYYVLEARSAVSTPGAGKTFTVVFETLQN